MQNQAPNHKPLFCLFADCREMLAGGVMDTYCQEHFWQHALQPSFCQYFGCGEELRDSWLWDQHMYCWNHAPAYCEHDGCGRGPLQKAKYKTKYRYCPEHFVQHNLTHLCESIGCDTLIEAGYRLCVEHAAGDLSLRLYGNLVSPL